MSRYIVIILLAMLCAGQLHAQNYKAQFDEARRLFNEQQYREAKDAFRALVASSSKHSYGDYSSFFYGLTAYQQGQYKEAKDMWLQQSSRNASWKQAEHVSWWLAAAHLKLGEYDRAGEYLKKVKSSDLKTAGSQIKVEYLKSQVGLKSVIDLAISNPSDELLATYALDALYQSDSLLFYKDQALTLIEELGRSEEDYFPTNYVSVKKDVYKVAVLFPFNYDGAESSSQVAQNRTVMDLYEGISMAVERLSEEGKQIALYPYDTKGNQPGLDAIDAILAREELLGMDLLIGPLYPRPFQRVFEFSKENRINMINPISESDMVMGDNPFSFLYKTGTTAVATQLADYAARTFENKTAYLFYEKRDSLLATTYRDRLLAHGYTIPLFSEINFDNYRKTANMLTAKDKINVKSNALRDSLDQYDHVQYEEVSRGGKTITYAEILKIHPDSVGHIFVSSQSNLAASNFVSAVIERPDTIPLIGKSKWLDLSLITYDQMEDIGLRVAVPGFVPRNTEVFEETRNAFIRKLKTMPSDFHFSGYELMLTMGNLMHRHGSYIQEGFKREPFIRGTLTRGFQYGAQRSNQLLPIVQVIDSELVDVNNKEEIENREE